MNPYTVFGIDKNSTKDEIKKKYRELTKKYHPDINKDPGAQTKFSEINQAYEILSDDAKRKQYDTYGNSEGPSGFGGFGGFEQAQGFDSDIFSQMFGDMFGFGGGARASQEPVRGEDIKYRVIITLEEAVLGAKKKISYHSTEACKDCKGNGHKGSQNVCKDCKGSGYQELQKSQGFMRVVQTCSTCKGAGKTFSQLCDKCHGKGCQNVNKEVEYIVPKGIKNGGVIRVNGQGEAGLRGGPAGDLIILFEVEAHSKFYREGDKLYTTVHVPILMLLVGGEVEVTDISKSTHKLKIPEGTRPESILLVSGLYIKLHVIMPKLSDVQKSSISSMIK